FSAGFEEDEFALTLQAAIVGSGLVVRVIGRGWEDAPVRVEHHVGGDEHEAVCLVSEYVDVLDRVLWFIADAIDHQVPATPCRLDGPLEPRCVVSVRHNRLDTRRCAPPAARY